MLFIVSSHAAIMIIMTFMRNRQLCQLPSLSLSEGRFTVTRKRSSFTTNGSFMSLVMEMIHE